MNDRADNLDNDIDVDFNPNEYVYEGKPLSDEEFEKSILQPVNDDISINDTVGDETIDTDFDINKFYEE